MREPLFQIEVFNQAFEDYKTYLHIKQYSSEQEYITSVENFLLFMQEQGKSSLSFSRKEIEVYYHHLISRTSRRGKPLAQNTVNHHLLAIKKFFDLLLDLGYVEIVPRLPKYYRGNYKQREILTTDEIKYLYSLCKNNRERALLSLAYGCGLRRQEIIDLDVRDIDFKSKILIVREGKNSKRREIPLSELVLADLRAYLTKDRHLHIRSHLKTPSFLITPLIGDRLHSETARRYFNAILDRSNNEDLNRKQITLHNLRHSIATHLLDNGAPLEFVKSFLGHSLLDTSQLYLIHRKKQSRL